MILDVSGRTRLCALALTVRRYFNSHKDVLLYLAGEGWTRWSETVRRALQAQGPVTPSALTEILVSGLSADPLFCDLLANVPLHLEHDVDVERVREFKRVSHAAVMAMAEAIGDALPGLRRRGALDVVTATDAIAATSGRLHTRLRRWPGPTPRSRRSRAPGTSTSLPP
jgi:hypothetical protein